MLLFIRIEKPYKKTPKSEVFRGLSDLSGFSANSLKRGLFVEKIGIIDLGSNNARLVIVEMLGDGHFIVIDQIKESVRLGKDMERDDEEEDED